MRRRDEEERWGGEKKTWRVGSGWGLEGVRWSPAAPGAAAEHERAEERGGGSEPPEAGGAHIQTSVCRTAAEPRAEGGQRRRGTTSSEERRVRNKGAVDRSVGDMNVPSLIVNCSVSPQREAARPRAGPCAAGQANWPPRTFCKVCVLEQAESSTRWAPQFKILKVSFCKVPRSFC